MPRPETTRDLNTVAKYIKEETLQAVDRYLKGNKKERHSTLHTFNDLIKLAEKLKKSRKGNETVATCQLNLAAAKIGAGKDAEAMVELNELRKKIEKEIDDSVLLAYVHFHLGLISPRLKSLEELNRALECLPNMENGDWDRLSSEKQFEILLLKERALEKIIQIHDEDLMRLKRDTGKLQKKMKEIKRKKNANTDDIKILDEELKTLKRDIEDLQKRMEKIEEKKTKNMQDDEQLKTLKSDIEDLQKRMEEIEEKKNKNMENDEQLKTLKSDIEDLQETMREIERKKVEKMVELEKVYERLGPLKKNMENILDEDMGDMLDKQVANLLHLGNILSKGDSAERREAKYYADGCREILQKDWSKVHVSICNDLGIIYSQMKDFGEAERCFLKFQDCWSNDEGDRSYVFQNVGAINVLREKYEDAVHSFKDALHVLEGQTDLKSVRLVSERRAHLYMNLGFACSQMGRGRIWKAFEAYFNAAKYASKSDPTETELRRNALKGMTISAMVVLDYREELVDFVYQYVIKKDKGPDKKLTQFEEIIEVKSPDENYETYIENLKNAVLDRTLPEEK